ncbi:MAG TPA: helix-turn-helix transcriptional regulator [Sphingopyxis sp.]|nr:helix-turn-helix transcriptional regulator [Sphingopyxis sp.]HMP43926.1 helix-turn-helix transcriptional regulator [Sphingopyxis sp.]HMQ18093.1 helix-turn-helix transcriptional regulator [Sphingopyxis sp.]
MIIGSRILERMQAVGLSQAELARRVGLAQPTIYNLIHKGKKGSTKLHVIARVLKTTPAYLTGETDDPESDLPDDLLTSQDREDLAKLQSLSSRDRETVRRLLDSLTGETPAPRPSTGSPVQPPTLHSPPRKFATGG